MKLYVYCLLENVDSLATAVSGISGARVDLLKLDDFTLLVSKFEGEPTPPVTRDNALAHAAVVASVLSETTPLPFRFGTVVSEAQLGSYVTARREALKAKLAHLRGCVEMSVKIIWNADEQATEAELPEEGPGARFLKEKRLAILGSERRAEVAKQVASWLQEQIKPVVRDDAVSLCPTEKLIVAASHLVPRERATEYRERLASAWKLRPELHFLVSGPWPPYSFCNIELEFKTRFGVS